MGRRGQLSSQLTQLAHWSQSCDTVVTMAALTYVIIGLLAAVKYAEACGVVTDPGTCLPDFVPVYADYPGANIMCIMLDKKGGIRTYENAKAYCESFENGFLAEPIGYLHQSIYELIMCQGYQHEAFWIGGTDEGHEDYWEWETSGLPMPRGTPSWQPCEPRQPLESDLNANHACMWEPDFYFFSCTEGIQILAMCQTYPQ